MKLSKIFVLILFPCCVVGQRANFDTLQKSTLPQKCDLLGIDSAKGVRLKPLHFITNVPGDIMQIAEEACKKSNRNGLAATAGATALLIPFDQSITDGVIHLGKKFNIDAGSKYKTLISVGKTKVLKVPQNINAGLYQLGEGGTSVMIAAGLYIYSKITNDTRSKLAAEDISETFLTMGIATQIIKRISGRQSPFKATAKGGQWRFMPAFHSYETNTPNYDAFPSGHLASMMATVAMLALDYPEKKWIRPAGITLMSLTGLVMIHDQVHWIGDYPLALALGYLSAKITYIKNHKAGAGYRSHIAG